jgi:hypothetical protein
MKEKKSHNKSFKIPTNHRNHQSSSKIIKSPEADQIKIYNTLVIPILLCGSEAWTLKERDKPRITAAEMKLMSKTAKYTWQDHKRNQDITEELKIQPVMENINNYKNKWIQYVRRMGRAGLPRAVLKYQPAGRRDQGRPLKRLLDG